jgi:hypothetical protein
MTYQLQPAGILAAIISHGIREIAVVIISSTQKECSLGHTNMRILPPATLMVAPLTGVPGNAYDVRFSPGGSDALDVPQDQIGRTRLIQIRMRDSWYLVRI